MKKSVKNFYQIIHLNFLKSSLINYLNSNPIALKFIMNFLSLFSKHGNNMKISLLRFCGAEIGEHVGIGDNVYIFQPKYLTLEDYVGIADNTVMRCWDRVHIGKYTFLAINSVFIPGGHRTDNYENLTGQNIHIGKGCWIGANCTIMGGSIVNNGCIIGAGTVLLGKEYPEFSIVAGSPGKIIKKRTPPETMTIPTKYNIDELFE